MWIHPINQRREDLGEFRRLVSEQRLDSNRFQTYFRMTTEKFDALLHIVGPSLQRKETHFRQSLSPSQRLAITLRYFDWNCICSHIYLIYRRLHLYNLMKQEMFLVSVKFQMEKLRAEQNSFEEYVLQIPCKM